MARMSRILTWCANSPEKQDEQGAHAAMPILEHVDACTLLLSSKHEHFMDMEGPGSLAIAGLAVDDTGPQIRMCAHGQGGC